MKRRTLAKPKLLLTDANGTEATQDQKPIVQAKKQAENYGMCKRLFKLVQILIIVVLIPPFLNYAALQKEMVELKPELGELYDIGWGQKLFKLCQGKGPPTVIFDAPVGMTSDVWTYIWPELAKQARVCVYDRAGLGFSDRPTRNHSEADGSDAKSNQRNNWLPFTVERMADDLYRLMTQSSQEAQPFILVGAELGALVSQFYSHMFEGQVLGLVLVNPLSDDLFELDNGVWLHQWYGHLAPNYQTLQFGAALGITRIAVLVGLIHHPMSGSSLPEEVVNRQKHLLCHPKHLSSIVDEYHFANESFSQLRTMRLMKSPPKNISVTVISGNYYDEQMSSHLNKAWAKSEQNLITKYYPSAKHVVINSADRHMLYRNPEAIIEQVKKMIRQWKSKLKAKRM